MTEAMVSANGVELCVQTFGEPAAPALLLIAGAASSMDLWDPGFCRRLADGGRYVARYDHRDTGGSVSYPPGRPGYSGADLVADAAALVDQLAGGRAHLVGLSMGAAIAQALAVAGPERVATLTLLSASPGGPGPDNGLPPIADRLRAVFADPAPEPDWSDRDAVVDYLVEGERPFAAPAYFDEAAVRAAARRTVGRTADPATAANHWVTDGGDDPRPRLGELRVPTLVIHGSADPFFPLGHGQALAREIPGARLLVLDGVGHQPPPPPTWDVVVPAILRHTAG
jgi:pimeloyl-ACP methyl ester carboxylesterase